MNRGKNKQRLALVMALGFGLAFTAQQAKAEIVLLDKNDWKFSTGGFVEFDSFVDTTRSFAEVPGNNPIALPGSLRGENGHTQFSLRNSRFYFSVLPPVQDEWKSKGYLEFDFLGYDPTPDAASGPTSSEASFYTNPTLRLRHAYMTAERSGWQILAGQTWTLFGWQGQYVMATASVPPVSGVTYERTPRVSAIKEMALSAEQKLQAGLSVQRPVQRNSSWPVLDAGLRWSSTALQAGFAGATTDDKLQPFSVALTGTLRSVAAPTSFNTANQYVGAAVGLDFFIPILTSSNGDTANTLALVGEYTAGKGYGDEFPGWTGNLVQSAATATIPGLDAGLGGYDAQGNFHLVNLQSFNLQLQYHLPFSSSTYVTVGYGQLSSSNMGSFPPAKAPIPNYDKSSVYFVSAFHDFTKQIRTGLEYSTFSTHYLNGVSAYDSRLAVTAYFRF